MRTLGAHPGLRRIWLFLGRCGLLFFVLAPGSLGLAEVSPEVESLKAKLANLDEKAKAPVLNDLAELTAKDFPAESLEFGRQALALAERFGLDWDEARARETLGSLLYDQKKFAEARSFLDPNLPVLRRMIEAPPDGVPREAVQRKTAFGLEIRALTAFGENDYNASAGMYLEAQDLYRVLKLPAKVSAMGQGAAIDFFYLGQLDKALDQILKALAVAEEAGLPDETATCSYYVGYFHRDMKNYDKALEYFQKSERLARQAKNPRYIIFSLNEIGNVYWMQGNDAQAVLYKELAIKEARKGTDSYALASCLNDLGEYHSSKNRLDQAMGLYEEALKLDEQSPRVRDMAIITANLASVYLGRRQYRRAVRLIQEKLPAVEKAELRQEAYKLTLTLKDAYLGLGDYPRAMDAYDRAFRFRDQIFNEEKSKQIAEVQTRFETNKKEQENAALKKENALKEQTLRNSRYLRNALMAITGLVLLLVGLVYSRYRLKLRANRKLEAANAEIREKQDQLKDAFLKMEELARTDALTRLPNRRDMIARLEQERTRFARSRQPFCLVMIDLDRFKAVNDRNGHDCGDALLQSVASLLRSSVRAQDQVGRWGGDEFLILLPETGRTGARTILDAIQERIAETDFDLSGRSLRAELSWGLSEFGEGRSLDDCLREADIALYENKKRKRPEVLLPS